MGRTKRGGKERWWGKKKEGNGTVEWEESKEVERGRSELGKKNAKGPDASGASGEDATTCRHGPIHLEVSAAQT